MKIKHDYYPFLLVLSPTFCQLGCPLLQEPFFTLSNVTVFWKSHLTCFYAHYVFSKLPLSFFFLFWCGVTKNSEVTLLSDIKQRPVFPDVQNVFPRSFATPHA